MKGHERDGRIKVSTMKIGNKSIGEGKAYVIAEFGVNHNGSLDRAKEGIREAAKAGADAIKFQTYTADELVVEGTPKFWDWEGDKDKKDQHEAYASIGGFPLEWYPILMKECEENNIEFLSTAFSKSGADYLNSIGMKAFKVASSDLSTLPYLAHIAKFGKPILLSTGAATMGEVEEAVSTIVAEGNTDIVLMHCTLSYPTNNEDANLDIIKTLKRKFPFEVGLSDHTLVTLTPIVAAAMGASVIEKHFTVDKTLPDSADHWLSIDPGELTAIMQNLRDFEVMRGSSHKEVFPCEAGTRKYDKRSLVAINPIKAGTTLKEEMFTYKRPGTGVWPNQLDAVIGKKTKQDIPANTIITWEMIA